MSSNYRVGQRVYDADVVILMDNSKPPRPRRGKEIIFNHRMSTAKMMRYLDIKGKGSSESQDDYEDRVWIAWCTYWHPLSPLSMVTTKSMQRGK